MNRTRRIALTALALVLAALAWWMFRGEGTAPKPLDPRSASASEPSPARGVTSESTTDSSRASQPAAPASQETLVEQPKILVHGRCVDRDGQAVAAATVALTELSWWNANSGVPKWTLPDAPGAADFLTHARSGPDGRFSITTKLPEPSPHGVIVSVEARKPGFCRPTVRKFNEGKSDFDIGDLVLGPGTRAAGFVRDALGNRCAGVQLWISTKGPVGVPAFSDVTRGEPDGSFAFENAPAAMCGIVARADDLRIGKLDVDLSSGEPRLDLEIVLPELDGMDSISGTVVDPRGSPVPRAQLREIQTSGPEPRLNLSTGCDERGRFRIDGRPDSVFEIVAYDRAGVWGAVRMSDIRSGTHGLVLQLDASHGFLLRVHDASGTPIERFRWERNFEFNGIFQSDGAEASPYPRGEVRLPLGVESFNLRITAPGWRSCTLGPLDPASMPEVVDAVLERACALRGIVRSGGKAIDKTMVSLAETHLENTGKSTRMGPPPPPTAMSGNDGRFEITVEGTGSVRLQAKRTADISPISDTIAVRPGEDVDGIVLELTQSGSIEGAVVRFDGTPGASMTVTALRAGKPVQSVDTDKKGSFRVPGLSEGHYDLSVAVRHGAFQFDTESPPRAGEPQRWLCEVHSGQATRLDLRLLESVRLRIALDLPQPPNSTWRMELWSWSVGSDRTDLDEHETQGSDRFDFECIDPIDAAVDLECGLPGWPRLATAKQAFERGAHELPLTLRAGRIEGALATPVSDAEQVRLTWSAGSLSSTAEVEADATGHFVFECAPEGECSIQRKARPGASKTVTVKAGESARVEGL
jgi:hypothetical protein